MSDIDLDDEAAEIAGLTAERARYVGIITKLQGEVAALENESLDDDAYFEKRAEIVRTIADHQVDLTRINAQLKTANIAKADRLAADAKARREANNARTALATQEAQARTAERAARAATNTPRRRPGPVVPPPTSTADLVGSTHGSSGDPLRVPLADLAAPAGAAPVRGPKGKPIDDLGSTIMNFAKGLRRVMRIPKEPEPFTVEMLAHLDAFIAAQRAHLIARDARPKADS